MTVRNGQNDGNRTHTSSQPMRYQRVSAKALPLSYVLDHLQGKVTGLEPISLDFFELRGVWL
jgi:hypothetical protein